MIAAGHVVKTCIAMGEPVEHTSYKNIENCISGRRKESHKGENGKVLVVAGSEDYAGAAALAGMGAMAALRSGVDIVEVAAPEKAAWAVNAVAPDIISRKMHGKFFAQAHANAIAKLSKGFDSALVGCGLGTRAKTMQFVRRVVKKIDKPLVLDADALKAVKGMKFNRHVLLTPHAKEFETVFGMDFEGKSLEQKAGLVRERAARHSCIVLLKGPVDIISDGARIVLNKTGNEGMTVGGTGDVLAGLCAGFAALSHGNLFEAACAAAYANGLAGDVLKSSIGYSFVASDLLKVLPAIIGRADSKRMLESDRQLVEKPWGGFERFVLNRNSTVKILTVKPMQTLSFQDHCMRDELWVALDPGINVRLDGKKFGLGKGKSVFLPRGAKHSAECKGKQPARLLEISLGMFDESDIKRHEDRYGRVKKLA